MVAYSYEDSKWKDLLTSYNGEAIEYDGIGNPTSYLGSTLSWQGRQLASVSKDNKNTSYTYDANGLRVSKTVNGVKTYYQYCGDKLLYQGTGFNCLQSRYYNIIFRIQLKKEYNYFFDEKYYYCFNYHDE